MPGTPMDQENGGLATLQTDNLDNDQEREAANERVHNNQHRQEYRPDPSARELTQTDKLNKRLLESLLERMSKSNGEFDRFMDEKEEESKSLDEGSGEF